jgi:hypothetical protein
MGMRGIGSGFSGALRRAARAVTRATSQVDPTTLAIVADLALAHLGVPGALTYSQYLTCRWRRLITAQCGHVLRVRRRAPSQRSRASHPTTKGTACDVDA